LEKPGEEVPEAGAVDRFDDEALQVHRGNELDPVVAEPFDDTDEGQDPGHGPRRAVAKEHLGLFGVGDERPVHGLGFDDAAGMATSFELGSPGGDGGDAVHRSGRQVGAIGGVAAMEEHAVSFDAGRIVGISEDLVARVAQPGSCHRSSSLGVGARPRRIRWSSRAAMAGGSTGWPTTTWWRPTIVTAPKIADAVISWSLACMDPPRSPASRALPSGSWNAAQIASASWGMRVMRPSSVSSTVQSWV